MSPEKIDAGLEAPIRVSYAELSNHVCNTARVVVASVSGVRETRAGTGAESWAVVSRVSRYPDICLLCGEMLQQANLPNLQAILQCPKHTKTKEPMPVELREPIQSRF